MAGMIRVQSIFGPTIQGEGPLAGTRCAFVRVGGCDYRCTWCDTPYAVDSEHRATWVPKDDAEVAREVVDLTGGVPCVVVLSGGNPAIQEMGGLVDRLHGVGYRVSVETQGSVWREWLRRPDLVVVSPKPPSAGYGRLDFGTWDGFRDRTRSVAWKVPVADEADFAFACRVAERYGRTWVQPVNPRPTGEADIGDLLARLRWLMERVARCRHELVVGPQLHVLAWGNERNR